MRARTFAAAALAMLLSACVSQPLRQALPPAQVAGAQARQVERELALQAQPAWSLSGRIAVSNGHNGGSGRIDWNQDGPRFDVSLSAPVTRQSWQLVGDAGGARLEGMEGGPREGADASQLLRDATGWDIPVTALADWVRGARARVADPDPATITYGVDGRPLRIEQGGWGIDYRWPEVGTPAASVTPLLPARLDARRGDASVRLIVDQWAAGAAQP